MLAAGLPIGKSLAEPDLVDQAKAVIDAMRRAAPTVPIPVDVVTAKTFAADAPATVKAASDVADDDLILDIGPKTAAILAAQLREAGTIVWNGPVGVFEFDAFAHGTEAIARAIADEQRVLDRRRRRHAGGHRQVRHREGRRLHLDRRRRLPRSAARARPSRPSRSWRSAPRAEPNARRLSPSPPPSLPPPSLPLSSPSSSLLPLSPPLLPLISSSSLLPSPLFLPPPSLPPPPLDRPRGRATDAPYLSFT